VHGPRLELVAGNARVIFTLSCMLICIGFYKFSAELPAFVSKPLRTLGEISYSVYMLHPIVHLLVKYPIDYVRGNYFPVPEFIRFFSAIGLTLVLSYFVYNNFEKFFIRLGKTRSR
jgi:peptidoglycan/LPS O-acetylase OafA/YrhL